MKHCRIFLAALLVLPSAFTTACSKRAKLEETARTPESVDVTDRPLELQLESPAELALGFGEQATLRMRVTHADDHTPAPDIPVVFAFNGPPGGSALSAFTVTSNHDGAVLQELTAGADKTAYSVIASINKTDIQTGISVTVDGLYKGQLKVTFEYDEVVPLPAIITRVHPGDACSAENMTEMPPPVAEKQAAGPHDVVIFEELVEADVYSVSASTLGRATNEVASGCVVAPPIAGRGVVNVRLPITLHPATLEGTYDFVNRLHLTETLPGKAGDIIDEITRFFMDPADMLAEQLVQAMAQIDGLDASQIEIALGVAWAAYAAAVGLTADADGDARLLDDALEYALLDRMPSWVDDSVVIGGDISYLLTNLTVGGQIEIRPPTPEGDFEGRWGWNDFVFTWRFDVSCDSDDACCGRQIFTGDEVGLEPIAADITGHLQRTEDRGAAVFDMTVAEHRLALQYGNLTFFVFERLVLPPLTGENSLEGAVESLIGCEGSACGCARVGVWLNDLIPSLAGIGEPACEMALEGMATAIEDQLNTLNFDGVDEAHFVSTMTGTLEDTDLDWRTDTLVGTLGGEFHVAGGTAGFTGDVEGVLDRPSCEHDGMCEAFETCHVRARVLNTCEAELVCALPIGSGVAGSNGCTDGAVCQSGVCLLESNTCFTACTEDADCPSNTLCAEDPVNVSLEDGASLQFRACGV